LGEEKDGTRPLEESKGFCLCVCCEWEIMCVWGNTRSSL